MTNLAEILNSFGENGCDFDLNIEKIAKKYKITHGFVLLVTLSNALRSLGCFLPSEQKRKYFDPKEAAQKFNNLITKKRAINRYICPLEYVEKLPNCAFGSARIGKFNEQELFDFFDAKRLICFNPKDENIIIETIKKYSQFFWMIFEEDIELKDDFMGDWSFQKSKKRLIHQCQFPNNFRKEVAAFLLAPWEDWETNLEENAWKFFNIPWVYKVDGNLFVNPRPLPSYENFVYDIKSYSDSNGKIWEYEVPLSVDLLKPYIQTLPSFLKETFEKIDKNLFFGETALFFLINAYDSDGIYEFISHITAIEAAIGQKKIIEVDGKNRKNIESITEKFPIGITKIVAIRIAGLFKNVEYYKQYLKLFNLRSNFVHGSDKNKFIEENDKIKARRLARLIITALLDLNVVNEKKKEVLKKIFEDGICFLQGNGVDIIEDVEILI
ncbi:MAG: hypothetical protein ABF760_00705 [Zymomonas mobilis]